MGQDGETATSDARATLLRALEQIEAAEQDLEGTAERCDLCVVYSIGRTTDDQGAWHEVGGWASTSGPTWMHTALLRRAADAKDDDTYGYNPSDDDD